MYNRVILMGRICHDLELKTTPNGVPVLSFRLAVERNYQVKGEDRKSDFFNVVAWRNNAEFISRYFFKGRMILLDGELQTRQYVDKNNVNRDIVEIIVDHASFTGEPKQQPQGDPYGAGYQGNQNYQSYNRNNQGGYQGGYSSPQSGAAVAAQAIAPAPALSQGDAQDFVDNAATDDDYPF
ncbi:MAG: single-stranded DNA-binding protein [Oscillospiraceae bacterium]|nr:single-stranded DNA-binding protein [Oscillospiraceae bacterium]